MTGAADRTLPGVQARVSMGRVDVRALLLGLARRRAAGAHLTPFLLGGNDALHGEEPAPFLLLGIRPRQTLVLDPATPPFPWSPGAGAALARVHDFIAAGGVCVGWIGHEIGATRLARHDTVLRVNRSTGEADVLAFDFSRAAGRRSVALPPEYPPGVEGAAARAAAMAEELTSAVRLGLEPGEGPPPPVVAGSVSRSVEPGEHRRRVRAVLQEIRAGEVYQVNIAHPLRLPVPQGAVERMQLFLRLWHANRVPYPSLVEIDGTAVLSMSPERYLARVEDRIESCPIKGTRARGGTPEEDRRQRDALRQSAKDRAENIMIVDLVRNDIGRVARTASVETPSICRVESFASVHHLVSTVTGTLKPGTGVDDILAATHPPGSMTGAPKMRAVEILSALEGGPRGAYAGGIGWWAGPERFQLSMVIRSLVLRGSTGELRVGGGIVADSDPAEEDAETLHKARSILEAIE